MRQTAKVIIGVSVLVFSLSIMTYAPQAAALGQAPTKSTCKKNPKDIVTRGGCVVINRKKGNCMACHKIAGTALNGNVGTVLKNVKARYRGAAGKKRLRAQIYDATQFNKDTMMPPFGRHKILTKDEIDAVVEFVLTL